MRTKILVLGDTTSFWRLLLASLEDAGYVLFSAADEAQCLSLALSCAPDLLLLEVKPAPEASHALCQLMAANPKLKQIPVVMLANSADEAQQDSGLKAGARAYLVKPVHVKELLALFQRLLGPGASIDPLGHSP
ncbi:PleD family two-component system response regulator [Paucibacter sp. Y2R2-4]|uniref:response regulator n=1 Tax=Paucibacter sp. Y2R2-4 TaxID=2893553 RepID=UPI0021E4E666|nr:response regulator [Paucibacter sp. Y2R2-4]MCV2348331.1 response regulator [Paucibacter sp. Y2R2-4]